MDEIVGSEAMEAAMKLARQYFLELSPSEKSRTKFIARKESYHGTTLGALSMGGHVSRRALYEPMLLDNISRVSYCNAYRGMTEGETDEEYIARLAKELDDEFVKQGPENVCAFVAEPVVGAVCFLRLWFCSSLLTLLGVRLRPLRSRIFQSDESGLRQAWSPTYFG
jgi:adenosylmethionine-8-amino-7-oxononanoate aminotransferase